MQGQYWTVTKAFQGKAKDSDEPEVVPTKGGDAHKWLVQVENQPVAGWFSVLKKPGNTVEVGSQLYGTIEENNWGKAQFTRMQEPQDGSRPAATNAAPKQSNGNRSTDEKLDYIISLLENRFRATSERRADVSPEDIDDKPVDLSELDI